MLAGLLLVIGLVMLVIGLFVGVEPYELTLFLISLGVIVALTGAYLMLRARRVTS